MLLYKLTRQSNGEINKLFERVVCNGVRSIVVVQTLKSTDNTVEIVIFILIALVALIVFIINMM